MRAYFYGVHGVDRAQNIGVEQAIIRAVVR